MATLFIGLPMVFGFNYPKFKTFKTQRSIVLGGILEAAATSSTWYPNNSFIEMARHRRSSLNGRGIADFDEFIDKIPIKPCGLVL